MNGEKLCISNTIILFTVKKFKTQLLNKNCKNIPTIRFGNVGKSSPAHKAALDVFRGKKEADFVVSAKEVLGLLYGRQKKTVGDLPPREDNP